MGQPFWKPLVLTTRLPKCWLVRTWQRKDFCTVRICTVCGGCYQDLISLPSIPADMSKVQDDEVGDGTTSVTVLAAELLRVGLPSQILIKFSSSQMFCVVLANHVILACNQQCLSQKMLKSQDRFWTFRKLSSWLPRRSTLRRSSLAGGRPPKLPVRLWKQQQWTMGKYSIFTTCFL